jgi:superfamily II DNA or RNA helicase
MRRLPSLRRWQRDALALFERSGEAGEWGEEGGQSAEGGAGRRSFLAVATPGAGKTTFALMAARRALLARKVTGVVVVVPTAHLKNQWADAAEGFGLLLEPHWRRGERLPRDMHGIIVTYQQAAAGPAALARVAHGAFAILDEVHHAGESRAWGDSIRHALEPAARRLCISGTPFRSDDAAIPFVRYAGDEAQPDYEYGYGDALADRGVVRPVFFPRINGHMEWRGPDGSAYAARFDDPLRGALASQRLRTALSVEGEWLPAVLGKAHDQLSKLRETDESAAGLIIATSQDHARGIARILRDRFSAQAVVATSDDPVATSRIEKFRSSRDPWLVAVRMVSEGVDIPRLRVGVFATTTTTDLFFRQAVGRLVRWVRGGGRQAAYMFIPDDPRIRESALDIKRARRHLLKPPEDSPGIERTDESEDEREQLDLFSVIAARALASEGEDIAALEPWDADEQIAAEEEAMPEEDLPGEIALAVPLPTREDEEKEPIPRSRPGPSARQLRRQLREANQQKVEALAHLTGLGHAKVNARLNQQVGIRKISEASLEQLQRRAREADRWLDRR